ncbi:DUF551 domain-containing protein [Enterobacter hormaechei]|uniref:DUF551 domain-containing protein n=1 Tax=Enterobacter hormaechei TaxID=158836 RepID=UPI0007B3BD9B|nr:DUF551 domain-containing protein [Enterobacter hormaechei]KZP81146.1 hypothetical protein A3N41_03035 [Enterobacter hormaechei subsp. steigerwaltii]
MITLTKEWLLTTIAELEEERDATPGAVNEDAAMALAAMKLALASLEADGALANEGTITATQFKPVADLYEVTVPGGRSTTFTKDDAEASDCRVMGWSVQEYVKLERYQAAMLQGADQPQSAQQNIPENIPTLREAVDTIRSSGIAIDGEKILAERDALNSPVVPDGWVACSEQMPKKNDKVLIFIDFNSENVPPSIHDAEFTGATFRRGGATVNVFPLEDGYGVTHWQPLPAAPQQEVK